MRLKNVSLSGTEKPKPFTVYDIGNSQRCAADSKIFCNQDKINL
jgi:hypothetical protein